ncbi:6-bladed beta-propeller [Algoriphagus chordae]|uniref:6-bladed beta-propeller protein n=1 Tax=Algoriphagus chordae TaxID=237019 RepID=A0A2W7QXI6_9BACT|nr:6-bladed beta-propeller protein [Algoriphagus chordae]
MRYNRFCNLLTGLSLVCWVFFSCSKPDDNELQTILIPKKIDQELQLEQLTKSLKLIQLETNESSFLTGILDVKLFNDKIYISDASRRILIFDQGVLAKLCPSLPLGYPKGRELIY